MITCILVLFYFATAASQPTPSFILGSGSPDEDSYRALVFENNKKLIDEHNRNPNRTYELSVNSFAFLTEDQIKLTYLRLIPSQEVTIKFAKSLISAESQRNLNQIIPQVVEKALVVDDKFNIQVASPLNYGTQTSSYPLSYNSQTVPLAQAGNSQGSLGFDFDNFDFDFLDGLSSIPSQQNLANKQKASQYESEVLNYVRNFFKESNKTDIEIEQQIIPQYKWDGKTTPSLSSNKQSVSPPRRLEVLTENRDVDWTCVSGDIKFQGSCGSCYTFSVVDSVSALLAIYQYTFHIKLSTQEILDCGKNSMTFGCIGGLLEGSFTHIINNGIYSDRHYQYTSTFSKGGVSKKCEVLSEKISKFKISDFKVISKGDCQAIKVRLLFQPIVIGIAGLPLYSYKSGVFNGCRSSHRMDHAVLLVGYKEGKGWKIKNSWGSSWGESGYAWLADGNTCRVCELAMYPIPSSQDFALRNYHNGFKVKQCGL